MHDKYNGTLIQVIEVYSPNDEKKGRLITELMQIMFHFSIYLCFSLVQNFLRKNYEFKHKSNQLYFPLFHAFWIICFTNIGCTPHVALVVVIITLHIVPHCRVFVKCPCTRWLTCHQTQIEAALVNGPILLIDIGNICFHVYPIHFQQST